MLAIKECLIREGVLNLVSNTNNTNNNTNNNIGNDKRQHIVAGGGGIGAGLKMDMLRYQKSVTASQNQLDIENNSASSNNNLSSSASATANTNCQQLQQQQPQQQSTTQSTTTKSSSRYQGLHPHLHHHTAPVYYTDVNLRIHTPNAADVTALNENYQSVYSTPSKLVNERERYFPKTTTATVAPPPIGAGTTTIAPSTTTAAAIISTNNAALTSSQQSQARSAFFRGGSAGNERKSLERYAKLSPTFANTTKGEHISSLNTSNLALPTSSPTPDCISTSLHRQHQPNTELKEVEGGDGEITLSTPSASVSSSSRSRNTHRFAGRKRAVRVRSESRPISALYDIICKEKGLDICTTTTNDEDSSAANSHDDNNDGLSSHRDRSSRKAQSPSLKQNTCYSTNTTMSGSLDSPPSLAAGDIAGSNAAYEHIKKRSSAQKSRSASGAAAAAVAAAAHTKKRKDNAKSSNMIIHDLSDDDDHDDDVDDMHAGGGGGSSNKWQPIRRPYPVKSSPRKSNLNDMLPPATASSKASSLPPYLVASNENNLNMLQQQLNSNNHHHQTHPNHHHNQSQHQSPTSSSARESTAAASISNHNYASSPTKLLVEPMNLHLSGVATSFDSTEVVTPSSPKPERSHRIGRKVREEKRRFTDGASNMSPIGPPPAVGGGRASDDEYQQKCATNAKRFITRQTTRTPSRGRSSVNGGGSDNESSSPSPVNRCASNNSSQAISSTTTSSTTATTAPSQQQPRLQKLRSPLKSPLTVANGNNAASLDTVTCPSSNTLTSITAGMTNSAIAATVPNTTTATGGAFTTDIIGGHRDHHTATTSTAEVTNNVDAVISHKKKDEEQQQHHRYSSPTSPRLQMLQSPKYTTAGMTRRHSSSSDNQKSPVGSESDNKNSSSPRAPHRRIRTTTQSWTDGGGMKLVPSVSVSMKQNLSELHFNGVKSPSKIPRSQTADCTVRITKTPSLDKSGSVGGVGASNVEENVQDESDRDGDNGEHKHGDLTVTARPRCSTMLSEESHSGGAKSSSGKSKDNILELSPVPKSRTPDHRCEDRDKSSKRKSNLNRSQNEEATQDGDETAAVRRRRRRELGMARQLIPSDDPLLREIITPQKTGANSSATFIITGKNGNLPQSPLSRNDLAFHMENARRGLDLSYPCSADRLKRAQTTSPVKAELLQTRFQKPEIKSPHAMRVNRRSDTLPLGELRKLRSNDVNRKLNERTKSDLAEIMKIAEMANATTSSEQTSSEFADKSAELKSLKQKQLVTPPRERDPSPAKAVDDLTYSMKRIFATHELVPSSMQKSAQREPSPSKHATFLKEECIYYEPEPHEDQFPGDEETESLQASSSSGSSMRQRLLKARSVERDAGHEPLKLSPIFRRKSTDDPSAAAFQLTSLSSANTAGPVSTSTASPSVSAHNHIVSILKKKDHIAGESSSASSNASPVTFSANVIDTPITKHKRAGILKKRSSLDESRYYSRSHSPDERSILIKSTRRNSFEEIAAASQQQQQQHGILKQSSYDSSKSDGCPSATEPHPPGILKKKDSTSTPSDGGSHAPKHVSISQAVILAAAELGRETNDASGTIDYDESGYTPSNEEYEIRPILKLESTPSDDAMRPPKPILKKKSSGDSDEHEIRPILKTSRKSSREEFDLSGIQNDDNTARQFSETTVRPILKTDSPSKRRSLGGEEKDAPGISGTTSPSLLKRRTRSLERQDSPVIDLAAAMNAITTSQTSTPVEFVSTPAASSNSINNNISVADRIKCMEKYLNNNGSPSALMETSGTWLETSLQSTTSGAVPKIFKPSAIRRDLYRDRYKTQPVTSDEMNFFKATSSPFDTSATSAFKPTKSLDALNYIAFANLQSTRTPAATSPSATNSNATLPFTLMRSATQPIQRQQYQQPRYTSSLLSSATSAQKLPFNSLLNSKTIEDTTVDISEQLALSLGSDSGRIFDMSGINDSSVTTTNDERATPTGASGGASIGRSNSVRARANMFQQLQQQEKAMKTAAAAAAGNREEHTSPRRTPHRISPSPAAATTHYNSYDEPKTPQQHPTTAADEEIEPSSLPLSERLRFFSSLSEASNRSSLSSYTRSPPHAHAGYSSIERSASASSYSYYAPSTPRSSSSSVSTSGSLSVTPTPMDYSSISIHEAHTPPASSITACINDNDAIDYHHNMKVHESTAFLKLTKSTSHTLMTHAEATHALEPPHSTTSITSSATLAPTTRRIKLKTIGKLMLPQTFLNNERNHNTETSDESTSGDNSTNRPMVKKIGKIKSPFIENCQQMQQKQQINLKCMKYDLRSMPHNALASLENNDSDISVVVLRKPSLTQNGVHNGIATQQQNGNYSSIIGSCGITADDANADSGKENYCNRSVENVIVSSSLPVVEMRKKFSRIINSSLSFGVSSSSVANRSATQPQRSTYNGHNTTNSPRSSLIEDKYAKYFGLKTTASTKEKENTTARSSMNGAALNVAKRNMQNMPDVCQVTPKLRCSGLDNEQLSAQSSYCRASTDVDTPPLVAAINQNVRLQTSTPLFTPPSSAINVIEKFTPAATTNLSSSAALKRREMAKRSRAVTTIVTTTSSNFSLNSSNTPQGNSGAVVAGGTPTTGSSFSMRSLRTRAHTITHGVHFGQQIPEVKKFEDIIVTKEEFLLASKEFERIFLGTL